MTNGNGDETRPQKVFTLALTFELGSHKTSRTRLRAAYNAGVRAAMEAVQNELLTDSIVQASSTMAYDYRWIARSETLGALEMNDLIGNGNGNGGEEFDETGLNNNGDANDEA
jgi:hypothetical protein